MKRKAIKGHNGRRRKDQKREGKNDRASINIIMGASGNEEKTIKGRNERKEEDSKVRMKR